MLRKLLIVEDDVDVTSLLFDTFTDMFDIIDNAYSVEEALKLINENSFSLILLDIKLNNRNGAEIVKYIADSETNLNKETPVVIVSGIINANFIDHYKNRFAGIILKPFEHDDIRKIIGDILGPRAIEENPEQQTEEIPELKYAGPFAVDALKEQVDQVMVQVKKSAKLKQFFKMAKVDRNADNYILTHVSLIVNISAAICVKMDWNSDKTLEKFVYAAYLHDLAIAFRPDLARMYAPEKLELLKDTMPEDDYRIIMDHPNLSAKMISGLNEIPPDVDIMIKQHHELPTQGGFPTKCGYQKIPPLSAVFIVAHSLADYIVENPKWDINEFVKKNRSRLHGSHFTKIMRTLPEIK